MTTLGWIGVWLLVVAGILIAVELALMAVWGAAMGNRARMLAQRLETERGLLQSDSEELKRSIEEMQQLWQPYRQILGWLGNPLVVALLQSYRRRMAAR